MKPTQLANHLTRFLSNYLSAQRDLSPNTVRAYRDTFTLLLRYCRDVRDLPPERLEIGELDAQLILDFLAYIESERGCGAGTRNNRLTAIQAFFRYLQTEEPDRLAHCQRILAVPRRRSRRPEIGYLRPDDLAAILAGPDLRTEEGRRDAVLLSVLYDTGARVQELVDLQVRSVRLEAPAQVRLFGKGRKARAVPLLPATVKLLGDYIRAQRLGAPERLDEPLFRNRDGHRLTRSGVRYIIDKYTGLAREKRPGLPDKVTPHTFRHTKAMHLVQAGNHIVVIRDILGHTDISTTSIYARADLDARRQALEKAAITAPQPPRPSWQRDDDLLTWLKSL